MNPWRKKNSNKEAAEKRGRRAELFALLILRIKGYAILKRRYRTPTGEIDLIARRGSLIAFVEVKARSSLDDAVWSVNAGVQRRITAAAGAFMARQTDLAGHTMRYDIFAISGWRWRHIKNAWIEGD